MTTNRLLILVSIFCLLISSSCKKSEDELSIPIFNTSTVEDTKTKLEADATNVAKEMETMEDLQAMTVLDEMSLLFDFSTDDFYSAKFISKRLAQVKTKVQRSVTDDLKETDQTLSELFTEESGIYSWDKTDEVWQKVDESTSKIVYQFKMDNNQMAEVNISNFAVTVLDVEGTELEDITDELPTNLDVKITVDGKTVLSYNMVAQYYTDMLKYSKETLSLEGFIIEFITDLTNKSKVILSSSFKHNDFMILASSFEVDANKNYDAIITQLNESNDNVYIYNGSTDYDYEYDYEDEYEESDPLSETLDLINKANMTLQLGNVKLVGIANIKGLSAAMNKMNANTTMAQEISIMNKNLLGYVMFADESKIIAKAEFVEDVVDDNWGDEYSEMNMRVVFKDGSAVDDTFLNENFASILDMFASFNVPSENY